MILRKFNVLQDTVNLLVVIIEKPDPKQDNSRKIRIGSDFCQIRSIQQDLIFADIFGVGAEEDIVGRTFPARTKFEGGIPLQ